MIDPSGNYATPSGAGPASKVAALLLCLALLLPAPDVGAEAADYRFVWVRTLLGPCCGDAGSDLAVDTDGGVLVAGHRGGLDLDRDGRVDVQTRGSPEPLVMRTYDDHVQWVQDSGGPGMDFAFGVAPDGRGGVYAVGEFMESLDQDDETFHSAGKRDGFVARYDRDGNALWAHALGGADNDSLDDVQADAEGNAYVTGTVRGAVDSDGDGEPDLTTAAESAMIIASYDLDGNLRWLRISGGAGAARGRTLLVDSSGAVYVSGFYYGGSVDLDGDGTPDLPAPAAAEPAGSAPPQPDFDGFVARFDPSGRLDWVRAVTGPGMQFLGALAFASNGDLLVAGMMTASADLDQDGKADIEFQTLGENQWEHGVDGNTFLLRVTNEGKTVWSRRYITSGAGIAAHGERIALVGSYNGDLDVDGDGVRDRDADPDRYLEGFVALLDGDGTVERVFTIVGGDSDVASAAAFSPDGKKLYVTGYTKLGADFDGDDRIESASACHQLGDIFIALYDVDVQQP